MRYKTFEQLCNEIFGLELTHLFRNYYGYDDEFYTRNAYDGLVAMKTEFGQEYYYNILIGGLSQIVESIKKELEKAGVIITLNLKLVDMSENNAEFVDFSGNTTSIEYSKLILALDKHSLTGLSKLVLRYSNVLNSVEPCHLMRIYAKFPINPDTKIVWFHGLSKTSTNSSIRSFIPINEETGLCMISYSDGNIAKAWQDLAILGDLEHYVMKYIREMYPEKDIPEPEWIKHYFWHNGCYFYIPYVDSSQIIEQIIQPFDNIFICGECYSGIQGWIEGALDSSIRVVDLIKNNSKKDDKQYTMAEVAASDSLTVIDGNVYNLLKNDWIDRHPGGEIIKKAIGKDATEMFTYINHPKYAKDILEELFVGIRKD
jgi:cytochrome b involved in lipid metabolism